MDIEIPFIGKRYKVIAGPYLGFEGQCVSIDLRQNLPVILQDDKWNSKAVRVKEIQLIGDGDTETNIPHEQKN